MAIKRKLGIVGAGNIGGILLLEIAARKLARTIGIVDIKPPAVAAGKALDVAEGTPIINADVNFVASRDFSALEGCECVINTAGVPRAMRPDGTFPSREELLATNLQIADAVADGINTYCPDACLVNIANPLDAIVYRLHQKLKKPKHRISGMAGVLDTARYRLFIAQEAGVSVENVEAMVLGCLVLFLGAVNQDSVIRLTMRRMSKFLLAGWLSATRRVRAVRAVSPMPRTMFSWCRYRRKSRDAMRLLPSVKG